MMHTHSMKELMVTPFSSKVSILGNFYADVCEDEVVLDTQLMRDHQFTLGVCLASLVNHVTIQGGFHHSVDYAWNDFCEYLGVDNHGEYNNLVEMMEFADE
jgi:hypothetical protein